MKSMLAKSSKGSIQKPAKFIAPGTLASVRGYGQKVLRPIGNSTVNASAYKSTCQNQRPRDEEREAQHIIIHRRIGGVSAHTLIMHYGDDELEETDFTEDSSFLDILNLCRQFIDIYSVGFKVTDGDGKPLRNDRDLLAMLKEHEDVEKIDIYIDVDETAQPVLFKLPEDNPACASTIAVPRVRDISIVGEYKINEKVIIEGNVVNGAKDASTVQFFMTTSKYFDMETDLKAISECMTNKEFQIPVEAIGHYLVVKFTPMTEDGESGEPRYAITGKHVEVGQYHSSWSRHLGIIVRDKQICPIRVKTWKDLTESDKEHLWATVKECFSHSNIELYREHTLEHMCALWTAWRSELNVNYVKPYKTEAEILKKLPPGIDDAKDWEWLVKNRFLTEEFLKLSNQNSQNRANGEMPHRTGSMPHRQVIFEMGGKDDNAPDMATVFYETRQKGGKFVKKKEQEKYDELVKTIQSNPSLPQIRVVETCFGPQRHGHVFGFGGGMKRKNFDDRQAAYIKELEAKVREKTEENNKLQRRMDKVENRLARIENGDQPTSNANAPPTTANDLEQVIEA